MMPDPPAAPAPDHLLHAGKPLVAHVYLAAAVAISAGVPGLLPFDVTGLTRVHGLFNISSGWRMAVFGLTGLMIVSALLLWSQIVVGAQKRTDREFLGLALPALFFVWTSGATALVATDFTDLALAYYRIFEWLLIVAVVWNLISFGSAIRRFEQLVRMVSLTALVVVLAMLAIVPAVAQTPSAGLMGIQLGGSAYHPNYLSPLLGIGAIYWWVTTKAPIRYFVVPVMLLCWLLTGSRSGIFGVSAAMLTLALLGMKGSSWADRLLVRAGIVVIAAALLSAFLPQILSVLSRGNPAEDLTQLNARTLIWPVAFGLVDHSPWLGHGFIFGPRLIGTGFPMDWLAPSHAHNDLLNAAVAAGIPGALILTAIYSTLLVRSLKLRAEQPLLFVTCIPIMVTAMVEPVISSHATVVAVLVIGILRVLAIVGAYKRQAIAATEIART
jgi:O-antigen ligase